MDIFETCCFVIRLHFSLPNLLFNMTDGFFRPQKVLEDSTQDKVTFVQDTSTLVLIFFFVNKLSKLIVELSFCCQSLTSNLFGMQAKNSKKEKKRKIWVTFKQKEENLGLESCKNYQAECRIGVDPYF